MKQKLEISKEAWVTLNELAEFVESKNTLGAGGQPLFECFFNKNKGCSKKLCKICSL